MILEPPRGKTFRETPIDGIDVLDAIDFVQRFGRPDHSPSDRHRCGDAGREVAAPEQGQGTPGAPGPHLRGGA